jgi:hypothetical protein
MSTAIAKFGPTKTGLATVGYKFVTTAGVIGSRSTTGIYEIGGGAYGLSNISPSFEGTVLFDSGEGTPVFDSFAVNPDGIVLASGTSLTSAPVPIGQDLTIGTSDYWQQAFTATVLVSTGWTKFTFTIKRDPEQDQDSEALLLARVTNPAAGSDGLLTLNGQPAVDATLATIAVGSITPDTTVTVTLQAGALVIPPSGDKPYTYELTRWISGRKERIATGSMTVERTVIRAVAAP